MLYIMEDTALDETFLEAFFQCLPLDEQELLKKRRNRRYFLQSLQARALLLYGLRREYGIEEFPRMEREEMGKPYFPQYPHIHFNYSHSDNGILVGISEAEIGVDIQSKAVYRENTVKMVAHPSERLLLTEEDADQWFTRLWCLKEAYVKYKGTGIRRVLNELDFSEILKNGSAKNPYCRVCSGENYSYAVWSDRDVPELIKI